MAYVPTTAPLKNGLVRLVRSSTDLRTALRGGIHERVASPGRLKYPFMVYSEVSAPLFYSTGAPGSQGTVEIHALFDISVFSMKPVEANNLDSLLAVLFSSPGSPEALSALVSGQKVYHCHRVGSMPTGPELDDEGRRIVQTGGQYEIWSKQPIPLPT